MTKGIWYAVLAYLFWGFVPVYCRQLQGVPALQLICHRIVWSSLALAIPAGVAGDWRLLPSAVRSPRIFMVYAAAAGTLAFNWFVYVWAVNAGYIVQTALGYFINPLLSVLLGVIVLGERLRRAQWMAIALAAVGVLYLTIYYGAPPWIALSLAGSFALYGLLKKKAPLGALQGLTIETATLVLPALAFLIWEDQAGRGAFIETGAGNTVLMMAAGPVTTIPLLLFAAAAPRIPLSMMGMLQYLSPTIQFLIGVYVYKEPFTRSQFVGYACVWMALALLGAESLSARRLPPRPLRPRPSPRAGPTA